MVRYCITIFLSAFLLFQVQPLMGKYILPWFGGTPAVWTACMLFFQTLLVFGYAYAHGMARLRPRTQLFIHIAVLGATALLLPITPAAEWKPVDAANPTGRIFLLLLVSVGAPYLVLSSTAPLLQSWFGRAHADRSPYGLYALSNTGSLLGLFAYPFLVEPTLAIGNQTWIWSLAYGAFLLMCGWCALDLWRTNPKRERESNNVTTDPSLARRASVSVGTILLWLALSACGSIMLLATTNKMCQDVASVPLLWVLPLGIYLLSFIVMFGRENWYSRRWYGLGMLVAVVAAGVLAINNVSLDLVPQIVLYTFVLAMCCFLCHGELVQLKPSAQHLTVYYVTIAVGGAIGGVLVSLVAPLIFVGYFEFNFGLVACIGLLLLQFRRERWTGLNTAALRREYIKTAVAAVVVALVMLGSMWNLSETTGGDAKLLAKDRNFYGSVRVMRRGMNDEELDRVVMAHGNTIHGVQFQNPADRRRPTMYYTPDSGVGMAIRRHPVFLEEQRPLRVGVIGLGAGTLCCYAREGDVYRYYEIDPLVSQFAEEHFTFLGDARERGAKVTTWLGDARIVMERQLAADELQEFDVLVVDAFSSDAIPLHLLTEECFDLYRQHLAEDGVLAVHVSNRYLDLRPAVRSLTAEDEHPLWVKVDCDAELLRRAGDTASVSEWVLLTTNRDFVADEQVAAAHAPWPKDMPRVRLTDSFSSLFALIRW